MYSLNTASFLIIGLLSVQQVLAIGDCTIIANEEKFRKEQRKCIGKCNAPNHSDAVWKTMECVRKKGVEQVCKLGTECAVGAAIGYTLGTSSDVFNAYVINKLMENGPGIAGMITSAFNTYSYSAYKDEVVHYRKMFEALREESKEQFTAFPEEYKAVIRAADNRIITLLESHETQSQMASAGSSSTSTLKESEKQTLFELMRKRNVILMSNPMKALDVAGFGPNDEMTPKVRSLIDQYPEQYRDQLAAFAHRIRENSVSLTQNHDEDAKSRHRGQIYLHGPPGIGKSHFVKTLATTLGLPLCHLDFGKIKMNEFLGSYDPYGLSTSAIATDDELFGRLYMCFAKHGVTNPILFFDEFGDMLNSAQENAGLGSNKGMDMADLKHLFDPETKFYNIFNGKYKLDISRATFIMTGNVALNDDAFSTRVPSILFNRLTDTIKEQLVDAEMERQLAAVDDDIAQKLKEIFAAHRPRILELDRQRNPGGRLGPKYINQFANWIKSRLLRGNQISSEEAGRIVEAYFSKEL